MLCCCSSVSLWHTRVHFFGGMLREHPSIITKISSLTLSLSFSRTTSKNEHAYHDRVFPQILLSVCEETSLFRVVFFSRIATVIFYIEIILISPIASHKIKSNTIGCWVELQSFKIKLKFAQKPSREDFKVILKCKVLKIFTSLECNCYVLQEMHFI